MNDILNLPKDRKIILATHSGSFHPDDVFATAVLDYILKRDGYEYDVIRTRTEEEINSADIVYDVGLIYDPTKFRFDHHQSDMNKTRDNVPYSSLGLVWETFGESICDGDLELKDYIDNKLVKPIDLDDNGIPSYKNIIDGIKTTTIAEIISDFNPIDESNADKDFNSAVSFAKEYFKRVLSVSRARVSDSKIVRGIYNKSEDKNYLVFDYFLDYKDEVDKYPEIKFVIYPEETKTGKRWHIKSVYVNKDKFNLRASFPESWRGRPAEELSELTNTSDLTFCHKSGFLCVTSSLESAIRVAKLAIG